MQAFSSYWRRIHKVLLTMFPTKVTVHIFCCLATTRIISVETCTHSTTEWLYANRCTFHTEMVGVLTFTV